MLKTGIYILSERLISYPIFRERMNFDAISSVLFWRMLLRQSGKIYLTDLSKLHQTIKDVKLKMHEMERASFKFEGLLNKKKALIREVETELGDYATTFSQYQNFWGTI